ncbi:MAG TPA: helix-turn-helix domain-containing protein [Solirubrobacterales bacterium]|nr:helix-turn-helix domain-containing protein [Solirubrobacterales bacterium]
MGKLDGKKLKQVIDPTHAKVFTHPLRGHVWVTLFERGVVSPTEIANELELEPSDVSYHFRKLHRKGLIRLVRTERRRGFDEHFYEPVAPAVKFEDEEWMGIPEGIRSSFSGEALKQLTDSLAEALEAGSFDARDRHLSRTWLRLDRRGWQELTRVLRHTLDRIQAIQQRSAERCNEQAAEAICVEMAMVAFETVASMAGREGGQTDEL